MPQIDDLIPLKTTADLEALHAAITDGPEWRPPHSNRDVFYVPAGNNWDVATINPAHCWGGRPQARATIQAIGLLPRLLAEVIALRKETGRD